MVTENPIRPALATVAPLKGRMTLTRFLRLYRDSTISTFREDDYEEEIVERKFFGRHSFLVNNPEAVRHILLDNVGNYEKPKIMRRIMEPGLGMGLLTSEGPTWRRHRRIMAPAFHSRSIASYSHVTLDAARTILDRWDGKENGSTIDIGQEMMRGTLEVILRTMFSADSKDMTAAVSECVDRYQTEVRPGLVDILGLPAFVSRYWRARKAKRIFSAFDGQIEQLLRARERSPRSDQHDLLARLTQAGDSEGGGQLTQRELRDQVVTILMAGHETTANALTWVWYLLSCRPEAEAKLHNELDAVLGRRMPDNGDIESLKYTRMVVEETLRLYPPAHTVPRQAVGSDRILGRNVPPGALMLIVPWILHRHRKLWRNPHDFDPERFSPEREAEHHRFAYIPFGAGPRVCIGAAFATAEMVLIVASIAQCYRLRVIAGEAVEPQALITLRPRGRIRMTIERR
jgi:cytochrome P450